VYILDCRDRRSPCEISARQSLNSNAHDTCDYPLFAIGRCKPLGSHPCRFCADQAEYIHMEQQVTHKTFRYKLIPTPPPERELERVLGLCPRLYNAALEQRKVAWERRRVSLSRYQQEAGLKVIRAEIPEYATVHSHVLQHVLARLDNAFRRFFARVKAG